MADDNEKDVKLNFSAETTKAIENVDALQKKINDLYGTVEKVNKAGVNNHNTLTSRQSSQVIRGVGSASEAAKEVSSQSRQLEGAYSSARKSGSLSPSDLSQLKQIIDLLHSSISQANASGVSSSGRVSPVGEYGQMYQGLSNMHVRPSKIFLEGTNREDRYSQAEDKKKVQEEQRGMRRAVNHYSRSSTHYSDSIDTTISHGKVTYNRNKELNGQYDSALGGINSQQENVRSQLEGSSRRKQDIGSEMNQLRQSISSGKVSGDGQAEADRLSKLEQEDKELAQTIANLKSFNDTLKKSRQNLNSAKARYDTSTESGNTSVGYDPNSFMGMMQRRMPSTVIGATATALSGLKSASQSGNQSRLEAESSVNADTLGSIANGTGDISHRSDVRYLKQLSNTGINNGTDYSGTQMAQFAGTFTGATGNTNTSAGVSAANSTSQLARFTGMGTSQANSLISALGTSGAISNGRNTTDLSNTIAGEVYTSRMAGKSPQQAQALSSIINGQVNNGVTTKQAGDLAAVQGMQSKYGSTMQGAAGGSAYSGLASVATNGFNNPVSRDLFGGNNPKYAGVHGSALLYRDMTQATTHPWKLGGMIKNDLNHFGGDKTAAAANLSQLSGGKLSYKQALNYVNMEQKGKLNKSNIESQRRRDRRTGKSRNQHIRRQYSTQGNSTIDLRISIDQRGKIAMSNVGDGPRRAGNAVGSHVSPLLWGASAVAGGWAGSILSKGLGTLAASSLGGKGASGIADIFKALKGTKLGSAMSSAASWFKGTKAGSSVMSGLGKGKSILSGFGKTVKGSKFGQYASKASGLFRGSKILQGMKAAGSASKFGQYASRASGLFKGSKILQGMRAAGSAAKGSKMFEGVSKILGGTSKFLGKIATPLAVAGYASDAVTDKNHLKGASKGIGGTIGTVAGGIFGGPIGAIAGGWAGEKIGAGVYNVGHWFHQKGSKAKKQTKEYIKKNRKKGYRVSKSPILGMKAAGSAAKGSKMFGGASKLLGGTSKFLGKIATPLAVAGYASDAITDKNHLKGASRGIGGVAGTIAGGIFGGPLGAVAGGWAGEKLGAGVYNVGHWFHQQGSKAKKQTKEYIKKNRKKGYRVSKSSILGIGSKDNNKKPKSLFQSAMTLLKGFNDMLDKAMKVIAAAKSIKTGSGSGSSGGKSGKGTGKLGNVSDSGSAVKQMVSIADAVGKATGVKPGVVMGQLWEETGGKLSQEALKDHNFAGIKGSGGGNATDDGGTYQKFSSNKDFAKYYAKLIGGRYKSAYQQSTFYKIASSLHNKGYFTDPNISGYAAGMRAGNSAYKKAKKKHATGGIYSTATDVGGNNVVGEDGLEAAVPLGAGHQGDTENMLNVLAGTYGKKMVSSPEQSSTSSGVSIGHYSPNNSVVINGANKTDDELVSKIKTLLSSMKQKDRQSLLNYYSNSYK